MRHYFRCSFSICVVTIFLAAANCPAADPPKSESKDEKAPPKLIKPEDAKDHDGVVVTVEFKVANSAEIDRGVAFLNSVTDRNDPKGFTAFITAKGVKKFKENPKTEKPADYFKGKIVRVTGAIKKFRNQWEIEVESPDQIKIVEEEKKDAKKS